MYESGLGQFNIAISSSDAVRRFLASQRYGTFGTKTPTTTTPIRTVTPTTFIPRTTTTFRPVTTVTPVLKAPVVKPSVSVKPIAAPQPVLTSGAPMPLSVAEESPISAAVSPTKSPLPLILAGLAALFLLNRKGR